MIDPIAELRQRLADAPSTAPATFIVPHTWPDLKNAEYEVLQRLSTAATNVGATMIAVDNDGYPLWANTEIELDTSKPIDARSVDFMICLHFESPRFLDVYSYYALWQPIEFYTVFGYEKSIEQMLTHTDCLSCRSEDADAHARNLFRGARQTAPDDFPVLFHSPPRPYLESTISSDSRLFYVGINWERINNERGRHHELLVRLDDEELIDIYGPKMFQGAEPWRGFKTYRGELPFDGHSVVEAVNKAGICLALSSPAHQSSALMSNRLFEGLAAGAAVIANPNEFIDTFFSDVVYMIDDNCDDYELYAQTRAILDEIRANPAKARARAIEGQKRLDDAFSLERSLSKIIIGHDARRSAHYTACLSTASVTVIVDCRGEALREIETALGDLADQRGVDVSAVVVCSSPMADRHSTDIQQLTRGALKSVRVEAGMPLRSAPHEVADRSGRHLSGPTVSRVLAGVQTDYVAFMGLDERWFCDHLGGLARALDNESDAHLAVSGAIVEKAGYKGAQKRASRSVDSVRFFGDPASLRDGQSSRDRGRFLYRTSHLRSLPGDCLQLLDGEEATLARLSAAVSGPLAQSGMATYVRVVPKRRALPAPSVPTSRQRGYIVDALATNPEFAQRSGGVSRMPVQNIIIPEESYPGLLVGQRLIFDKDKTLSDLLVEGFSGLEMGGVWIDGNAGTLAFRLLNPQQGTSADIDLVLRLSGRDAHEDGRRQHCSVSVNDTQIAYFELSDIPQTYQFRLPRNFGVPGPMVVTLRADHAEPVLASDGRTLDPRRLSLRLHELEVQAVSQKPFPLLSLNKVRPARDGGSGLDTLVEGFLAQEDDHIWLGSAAGKLRLCIDNPDEPRALILRMRAHLNAHSLPSRKVAVFVNGTKTTTLDVSGDPDNYVVPFGPADIESSGNCVVSLKPDSAEVVLGRDGNVTDKRILSVCLISVCLIDPRYPHRAELNEAAKVKPRTFSARFQRFLARNGLKR
ncbi:glycosyltransferase [Amorphus coralli]|uniref:glycosyltransferase family protein n=1 Tax=Amorphus coralli TaxID=340680 RepID=UPI0003614760|nr:glycosyltransferase [Amorphus coralli]